MHVSGSKQSRRVVIGAFIVACGHSSVVAAQSEPPSPSGSLVPDSASAALIRSQFLARFEQLQRKLSALANAIPAERYSWRPNQEVRSVAEVYQHLLSDHFRGIAVGFGLADAVITGGPRAFQGLSDPPSKAEVLQHLSETVDFLKEQIARVDAGSLAGTRSIYGRPNTIVWTALNMTAETHEHLGQLIAYARMIGVVPPWSQ